MSLSALHARIRSAKARRAGKGEEEPMATGKCGHCGKMVPMTAMCGACGKPMRARKAPTPEFTEPGHVSDEKDKDETDEEDEDEGKEKDDGEEDEEEDAKVKSTDDDDPLDLAKLVAELVGSAASDDSERPLEDPNETAADEAGESPETQAAEEDAGVELHDPEGAQEMVDDEAGEEPAPPALAPEDAGIGDGGLNAEVTADAVDVAAGAMADVGEALRSGDDAAIEAAAEALADALSDVVDAAGAEGKMLGKRLDKALKGEDKDENSDREDKRKAKGDGLMSLRKMFKGRR